MEGVISGRRGKSPLAGRWAKDIENTLGMKVHVAGELATQSSLLGGS